MVFSLAVRSDVADELRKEYKDKLQNMDLGELVKEFFSYLDYTEETDSGCEFHPITIGSVRCLMSEPLSMCMKKLRERVE